MKFFWKFTSAVYRLLGPKNAWRFVMGWPVKNLLGLVASVWGDRKILIRTKYGFLLRVRLADYIMSGFMHLGETNPSETMILRSLLRPGDVFLDVGAHMGWFALNAALAVGPSGGVYAFEPNPSVYGWLRDNIELNHFTHIVTEKCAVADRQGVTSFWIGDIDSLGSLIRKNSTSIGSNNVNRIRVQMTTLDTYAKKKNVRNVTAIKIDAEGADELVLKGASGLLRRSRPYLLIEVFGLTWDGDQGRATRILKLLKPAGYEPFQISLRRVSPYTGGVPELINLLFVHKTKIQEFTTRMTAAGLTSI